VSETKQFAPRRKARPRTHWTREFKLQALARMEDAPDITVLAAELGLSRHLLYVWRRKFRAGGAGALNMPGHPGGAEEAARLVTAALGENASQSRIAELERKVGQQQLDLDFFRAALRHVRETRSKNGVPGGTDSTRWSTRRFSSKALRSSEWSGTSDAVQRTLRGRRALRFHFMGSPIRRQPPLEVGSRRSLYRLRAVPAARTGCPTAFDEIYCLIRNNNLYQGNKSTRPRPPCKTTSRNSCCKISSCP
jgi:transposase